MSVRIMSKTIDINQEFVDNIFLINDYIFEDLENRPHKTMKVPVFGTDNESVLCEGTREYFLNIMLDFSEEYINKYSIQKDMSIRPNMQFSILNKDQSMGSHRDFPDGSKDNFVVMLYLNDDFIGGELIFDEFAIKVKPHKGLLVAFSSYYMHHVSKVVSGNRLNVGIGLFE